MLVNTAKLPFCQGAIPEKSKLSGCIEIISKGTVRKVLSGRSLCAEDGGQHDAGHECVVTGCDVLSIRSYFRPPQKHRT